MFEDIFREEGDGRMPTVQVREGHGTAWLREFQCFWLEGGPVPRAQSLRVEAILAFATIFSVIIYNL